MVASSLWLAGGRAVVNAMGFVSTIVLARLLMPEDFGLVALGTALMVIVRSLTEMSMAQALVHHRNPAEDHYHTAFTLNALRGVVLALLLVAAARPMAWAYADPRLENVVLAFAAGTLVTGLLNPRQIALVKDMLFRQQFIMTAAQNVVTVGVSVFVAVVWRSYWALVLGVLAGQVVQVVLSYAMLPYLPRLRWNRASELWSFSLWMTLSNAVNTINWRSDQLLVGGILGRSALGYYTVGDNLAQIPTRETVGPLREALFPALVRIADDPARLRRGYQRAQALITFVALPVSVGFALVAEPAVLMAMGEKWLPAVPVIQALSSVFALQTLGSMVQPLGMAMGDTRTLFMRDLALCAVRIPLVVGATLLLGIPGLILSRVFTGLFGMAINMGLVRRLTGLSIREQVLVNWRSLAAVAAMAAGVSAWYSTIAERFAEDVWGPALVIAQILPLGAALYLGAVLLLWLIARRPDGPETEMLALAQTVLHRSMHRPGRGH